METRNGIVATGTYVSTEPVLEPDFHEDPPQSPAVATRRTVLKWMIRTGWLAFAAAGALPALALKTLQQKKTVVAAGDKLVFAVGSNSGMPVTLSDIPVGTAVQAYPQGKTDNQNNLIQLVHLPNGDTVVGYSAICTHLGCAVLAKLDDAGNIACPCHGSKYNPAANAQVVGGPAPRPLPGLPVKLAPDGGIVANGEFSAPIGAQQ